MRTTTDIGYRQAVGATFPPPHSAGAEPVRLKPEVLTAPVLIVEDEAMIAWMLESMLEDMGFTAITVVATGDEALDAARRLSPGLIVSDINLGPSGLDGVAAAAAIRRTSPAPVLFVTGYAGADALDRIRTGVPSSLVLRKPIKPEELRQAVVDLVGQTPLKS